MALRTLLPWPWRRHKSAPAVPPAPPHAIPVGRFLLEVPAPGVTRFREALALEEPLPTRTPGLSTARRHAWEGARHGRGALAAAHAWAETRHDPTRGSETDVQHTAALHQLDTALQALADAHRTLDRIEGSKR